jgi:hypothetical protein
MDTTNLQLTDYLRALQVTLKSHHDGCRIVMLEAGRILRSSTGLSIDNFGFGCSITC